jgi:hypothetical protein
MMRRTLVLLVAALCSGCTIVYVTGDHNTVTDSNNHGDFGLTRAAAPAYPLQQLLEGHH